MTFFNREQFKYLECYFICSRVSESPPEVPLPQVVQEESSSVNHMPIHEDISPQKEEVTTMDDTEVDEIRLEV